MEEEEGENPRYWMRLVDDTAGLMRALARRADVALACPGLSAGVIQVTDKGAGPDQTVRCAELRDQAGAVSFVRAASQCAEVGLGLCTRAARRGGIEAVSDILDRVRPHIWPIMASAEPRLFWDPRPFWAGMDPLSPSGARVLWQLYVRLFLLACFDRYQQLRASRVAELAEKQQRDHQEQDKGEDGQDPGAGDPLAQRRPVRRPSEVGLGSGPDDEQDDADAETWPMSMLFGALDALSDEWNQALYSLPMIRLVARLLARYGMLGYARSSPATRARAEQQGDRCAHDLPEYTADPDPFGWVSVDRESYYGEGGAALRDMLSDLCAAVHADARMATKSHRGGGDLGASLRTMPLAQRLWLSLDPEQEAGGDPLLLCCLQRGLLMDHQTPLHSSPAMREGAQRCFASMHRFLQSGEAKEAEKCFVKSGVAQIMLPGEVWRFVHRWPDHGATPINVVNGLRARDMVLYRDRVMIPGAASLAADPGKSLPGCLSPLVDHLVWETARHMTRMVAVGDGTEALPAFLMESHQIKAPDSASQSGGSETRVWARFGLWTSMVDGAAHNRRLEVSARQDVWEETMHRVAERSQLLGEIPPFPQILLLGGRTLVWNPMAQPYDSFFDGSDDEDEDGVVTEDARTVREWVGSVLVDASSDSAPMTLLLWLRGRRNLIEALMDRVHPTSLLHATIQARSEVYHALASQWLHKPPS